MLFLDVIGIKITKPTRKEFGPFKSYNRTIRFEFFGGEVFEICLKGAKKNYIKLRSVKTLKPVPKSQPSNPDSEEWITPKVYKGTSEGRSDSEETVSCERCETSYPASAPGETQFVHAIRHIPPVCGLCLKMALRSVSPIPRFCPHMGATGSKPHAVR